MNVYSKRLVRIWLIAIPFALIGACGDSDTNDPSSRATLNKSTGITLDWAAPSEYEDGRPLSLSALTEFRLYIDQELVRTFGATITHYFLELAPGDWAVSMSVVAAGVESLPSEPIPVHILAASDAIEADDSCRSNRRPRCRPAI